MRVFYRLNAVLFQLLLSACACVQAEECHPLPAVEKFLKPGNVVLIGEDHGTNEIPAAFGHMVCAALEKSQEVSIGLELDSDQTLPLQAFLSSNGDAAARAALLKTDHWATNWDGRSSKAMLALVEQLRALGASSPGLSVFLVAKDEPGLTRESVVDKNMADRVRKEHAARPSALVLTLTGGFHSMLNLPGWMANLPTRDRSRIMRPMGQELRDLAPVSIILVPNGGSAWGCRSAGPTQPYSCGIHANMGDPKKEIVNDLALDATLYTAAINVGATTASAPAAVDPDK